MPRVGNLILGTDGTNVSVANSAAGGDPFTGIMINNVSTPGGGTALKYKTAAAPASRSIGLEFALAAATSYVWWQVAADGDRGGTRQWVNVPATPSVSQTISAIRSASAACASVGVRTTGVIYTLDAAGTRLAASDYAYTPGWHCVEQIVTKGTTTSNGRIEQRIYGADGTTVLASFDSGAAVNAGTAQPVVGRYAVATTGGGWSALQFIPEVFDNSLASGWVGPYVAPNVAPVALTGGDQTVDPGSIVLLDGTGSTDSDGTIVGWTWTQTSGDPITINTPTAAGASFTAPYAMTDKTYGIQLVTTDDDGATSSPASCVITVPAHPDWYLNAAGVWRPQVRSWL